MKSWGLFKVSGEYAMLYHAANAGAFDLKDGKSFSYE